MPCPICQYNQVKDVDRALLTGVSLNSLHKQYSFSLPVLERHQKHLQHKMAQAQQRFHDGLHQGLFCKLHIVMEMVLAVVRGARAGEDFKLFLQASREFTRLVSLMLKMDVHLEPEMIYCLMASHQWDLQDSLLPNSFEALAKTRQSLKTNLYAHCPEPEPEASTSEAPPTLETPNAKPQTQNSPAISEVLPKTLSENQKPATENCPKKKREKSAKLAPKYPVTQKISKLNQNDELCEKDFAKKSETFLQRIFRKWEKSGKIAGNITPKEKNI